MNQCQQNNNTRTSITRLTNILTTEFLNMSQHAIKWLFTGNVYLLFCAVNKLVLIGSFVALLYSSVLPQLGSMVIELLVNDTINYCSRIWKQFSTIHTIKLKY